MQNVTPALRITDYEKSKAFYVDGLGFEIVGEHRFAPNLPVFMTIKRDDLSFYLTQHAGDCKPGGLVFLSVPDVDAFYAEITARGIKPESEPEIFEGKMRDFRVKDPDGNTLDIFTPVNS